MSVLIRKLRQQLKRYPPVVNAYNAVNRARHNLIDIKDSYLSRPTKLKETPYGFKLTGSSSIHHQTMQNGTFETEELALFKDYLQNADVFVDVGANIGFYSCVARFVEKHVVAIEPLQKNIKYIYANLMANNWEDVEVFPVGLSDSPGLAVLYSASSTGASLIKGWAGGSRIFSRIIPVSTLDILLGDRFKGKKLIIKIDVEGAEYSALLGAADIMQMQPKPVWIIEICSNEYHPNGMNPDFQNIFTLFWKHGYEVYTANREKKPIRQSDIERWGKSGNCDSGTINYLFVPAKQRGQL